MFKETQATAGRERWGHTHMEVRQKGIDINRKTTSGVTVTIEFSLLHRCQVCQMREKERERARGRERGEKQIEHGRQRD